MNRHIHKNRHLKSWFLFADCFFNTRGPGWGKSIRLVTSMRFSRISPLNRSLIWLAFLRVWWIWEPLEKHIISRNTLNIIEYHWIHHFLWLALRLFDETHTWNCHVNDRIVARVPGIFPLRTQWGWLLGVSSQSTRPGKHTVKAIEHGPK